MRKCCRCNGSVDWIKEGAIVFKMKESRDDIWLHFVHYDCASNPESPYLLKKFYGKDNSFYRWVKKVMAEHGREEEFKEIMSLN